MTCRIGKEKTARALELLKEVHKTATKARAVYEAEQEGNMLQDDDYASKILVDLVICTKVFVSHQCNVNHYFRHEKGVLTI